MKKILFLLLTALLYGQSFGRVVYVDSSATGASNGLSWTSAYMTLTAALAQANTATSVDSIFIAAGTYYPPGQASSTDVNAVFGIFRGGIKLYGGFPAGGGARDTAHHVLLSGKLNPTASLHVVIIAGIPSGADSIVIDGLTITGGVASGGAGMQVFNGISMPRRYGGGLCIVGNSTASIDIRYCTIKNNVSSGAGAVRGTNAYDGAGGGVYVHRSVLHMRYCDIRDNKSEGGNGMAFGLGGYAASDGYGGGIFLDTASCFMAGCTFVNDKAEGGSLARRGQVGMTYTYEEGLGSAIYGRVATMNFANCGFFKNQVYGYGGAIYADSSSTTLTNCTLWGNAAYSRSLISWNSNGPGQGSAVLNRAGNAEIRNSILWANLGPIPMNSGNSFTGTAAITHSIYQGGRSGIGNLASEPDFVNADAENFRLTPCGAGVNAGDNGFATSIVADADGAPRIFGTTVDLGMYELQQAQQTAPVVSPITGPASWCPDMLTAQYSSATVGGIWTSTGTTPIRIDSFSGVATILPNHGDDAGVIRYTVVGSNGCAKSQTMNVITVSKAWVMVDVDNNGLFSMFVATPHTLFNPRWARCDSMYVIVGYGRTFKPRVNGSYVAIVDIGGCPDTSFCEPVSGLAIQDNNREEELKIFPNPASAILTVSGASVPEMIIIRNMMGAIVQHIRPTESTTTISLHGVSAGNYLIEVLGKQQRHSKVITIRQ